MDSNMIAKCAQEPSIPRLLLITRDRLDFLNEQISFLEDRLFPVLERFPDVSCNDAPDRTSENCDLACNLSSIVDSIEIMTSRVVNITSRLQL